ncbi:cell division cycle protein 23 homolog isoform X2 [Bombyx mandarina]|uniref:Cdc23 domain-containing protein n=2 Tax=Bombyx TaxID=7090 RepID=A0A8R2AR11_BOMMO|nr:cell division cycle protein 23 homolog isoform X2 [Bombyx mori]XP_028034201.1 cell division cycle protein 23 homolog isoform X2 [Bombyx mandarina]
MQPLSMHPKSDIQIDLTQVRIDILQGIRECNSRGLVQTTKWLAELNYALRDHKITSEEPSESLNEDITPEEKDAYTLAKCYFDCQEYDRAAHFLENCTSSKCVFLHKYSLYMSSEKKRLDNATDLGTENSESNQVLLDLLSFFKTNSNNLDGYLLYLEGVVLKKLDLRSQAVTVLQASVQAAPTLWAAWIELAGLANEYEALDSLQLPKHWMMYFFAAHAFVELKLSEQALEAYMVLAAAGFEKSTYITAQMAIAHHDRRDVDSSLALFRLLYENDPYRLDNWDVYSHLLYLKEKRMELANLAQRAVSIDKYRVETCCVIGNYYSLRCEHQKAVIYFQRALSLDPQYLSAWILMGHEFIELQNSNAAIQCYRQAIDVNRNDYRAWNGLGQAYEILGLNSYCIYYYSRAAQLKPDDSRMLVSLGEAYEKMEKIPNALKCYYKAHSTGDIEGMALFKLAKLYERSNMPNSAAAAYTAACQDPANSGSKELPAAQRYLAQYYLRFSLLDHAAHYAYKCLEHESTKEAGKNILKMVSEKRLAASSSQSSDLPEDLPEAIKNVSTVSITQDIPKTPLPSPNVTPENFSTPVFTRKNKL